MKKASTFKKYLKAFWKIVWKDYSLKGWIITLIFLFILIKLIIFPLINLTTGTSNPLVIVESCSMYHEGTMFSNTDQWYENHEMIYFKNKISKEMFLNFDMKKGFNKGDVLFITGKKPEKIELGDVIVFNANYKHPIIHRVIEITENNGYHYFSTLGDNNLGEQFSFETKIPENQLIGKAQANIIPSVGWIKLIFFEAWKEIDKDPETHFEGSCQEF